MSDKCARCGTFIPEDERENPYCVDCWDYPPHHIQEHKPAIEVLWNKGLTAERIAATLDVSTRTVYRYMPKPPPVPPSEYKKHDIAKWRHAVIEWMQANDQGPSFIGAVLGMHHTSILHHTQGECQCK